jgi:hypothetical protein
MSTLHYRLTLPVPLLTPENNPVSGELLLDAVSLDRVMIEFPLGCAGLVHVKINMNARQIIPWNLSEWVSGDGRVIDIPVQSEVLKAPYEFQAIGYSEDDTYPHNIYIDVYVKEIDTTLLSDTINGSVL